VDLNADGHADILSGSYSRTDEQPMAGLFQVLLGQAGGGFKPATTVNGTDGKPLIIPAKDEQNIVDSICTRPMAVDWDGDGDLDLVVGNFRGTFYLFTGEGGGKFAPAPAQIMTSDKPLTLTGEGVAHGDPFPVDWDNDGDIDLLSGSSEGGVQWAENTAGAKKPPALKPFRELIPAPKELLGECPPDQVNAPDGSTRVWVADVNGDSKPDILVGDTINLISPAKGVSPDDFLKRFAEWKQVSREIDKKFAAVKEDVPPEALMSEYQKHHQKRAEFMNEDRTGFVWVYLRK